MLSLLEFQRGVAASVQCGDRIVLLRPVRNTFRSIDSSGSVRKLGVMIVADHPIMRDSLRRLFRQQADMDLVCEVPDAGRVLSEFSRYQPDILLIDLQAPPGQARRVIDAVRTVSPLSPIVVLTTYPWEGADFRPDDSGTVVLLSKTSAGDEVLDAVRHATLMGGM
jgi:two-component system, NarL family, response regulator LiaR